MTYSIERNLNCVFQDLTTLIWLLFSFFGFSPRIIKIIKKKKDKYNQDTCSFM